MWEPTTLDPPVEWVSLNMRRDRARVEAHLRALEPAARRSRFLASVADSSLERYVQGLHPPHDVLIGALQAAHGTGLVGLAHLALFTHQGLAAAELGLSILAPARGQGLGRRLTKHAMAVASGLGAKRLVLFFDADNRAMDALARSIGGHGVPHSGAMREVVVELGIAPLTRPALRQPAPRPGGALLQRQQAHKGHDGVAPWTPRPFAL